MASTFDGLVPQGTATERWDTCLVFAPGQAHRIPQAVEALHSQGVLTKQLSELVVAVCVRLDALLVEAHHHKLLVGERLAEYTALMQSSEELKRTCPLKPNERILTTKWVLQSVHMRQPEAAAPAGAAHVGSGDKKQPTAKKGTAAGATSSSIMSVLHLSRRVSGGLQTLLHAIPKQDDNMRTAVDGFLHKWARQGWVRLVPLHVHAEVDNLFAKCLWDLSFPVQQLQRYYGDQVALYFAWMQHFTLWLLPPALVGVAITVLPHFVTESDTNPFTPFFSLFVVLWGVLFLRFWERKNAELAFRWGTLGLQEHEAINPEFRGVVQTSPVTGKPSLYYPRWKRSVRYALSTALSLALVAGALGVMVLSLNLQGYIRTGPCHIPMLSRLAAPGAIFDAESWYRALVPIILHVVVVAIMNNLIYRRVAEALTWFENHHYESQAYDALIFKRIAFEACNAFAALFYVAFVEGSVAFVHSILASLYMTSTLRRTATESLLPWLLEGWAGRKAKRATHQSGSGATSAVQTQEGEQQGWLWSVKEQLLRDQYDPFDDYLEMVIEFGYVSLFASAFPLAAAISVVANVIEMRSDAFRIGYVCQRPIPRRAASIGMWQQVLRAMVWLSVVTNCLLFAMSESHTNLLIHGIPASTPADVAPMVDSDESRQAKTVAWAWGIEHIIIVLALLLRAMIPSVPLSVRVGQARQTFLDHQARRDAALTARSRLSRAMHTVAEQPPSEATPPQPQQTQAQAATASAGARRRRRKRNGKR